MIVEQTASLSAKLVRERSPRIFRHPPSVASKSINFNERSFSVKGGTKLLAGCGLALIFSALITASPILGAVATSLFVFCYIYDDGFRRVF